MDSKIECGLKAELEPYALRGSALGSPYGVMIAGVGSVGGRIVMARLVEGGK